MVSKLVSGFALLCFVLMQCACHSSSPDTVFGERTGTEFGCSTLLLDNALLVGDPTLNKVYEYRKDPDSKRWILKNEIKHPSPDQIERFGQSLALWGNMLAIGAPAENGTSLHTGRVVLFERQGDRWIHKSDLLPPAGIGPNDEFGFTVCLGSNRLVASAPRKDGSAEDVGVVAIYERDGGGQWRHVKLLEPPVQNTQKQLLFGYTMAMNNQHLVVGGGIYCKAAFVYRCNKEWSPDATFQSPSGAGPCVSVALGKDLVAVGVPQLSLGAINWPGDALILQKEKDKWPLKARLTPDKSFVLRNYGIAVSLDGDSLIVGSDGVAWVYRLQQNQWQLRGELPVPKYKREQAIICSISQCQGKAALGVPSSEDESGPGFVKVVDLTTVQPQRP